MSLGITLSPAAFERVKRAVQWVEAHLGDAARGTPPPLGVEPDVARVTSGTADADGYYDAVITYYDAFTEAWVSYTQAVKLVTLNGETLVDETRYAVRPCGFNASDVPLYALLDTPGGGGATITVEEVDGSPTGSASTLKTNQAQALRVTSVAAGVATLSIDDASVTVPGIVSISTQSFAGAKYLTSGAVITAAVTGAAYLNLQGGGAGTPATASCGYLGLTTTGGGEPLVTVRCIDVSSNYEELQVGDGKFTFIAAAGGSATLPGLVVRDAAGAAQSGGTDMTTGGGVGGLRFISGLYVDGQPVRTASVPAATTSTGTPGMIAADGTHLYVCTAANAWRRVSIAGWA